MGVRFIYVTDGVAIPPPVPPPHVVCIMNIVATWESSGGCGHVCGLVGGGGGGGAGIYGEDWTVSTCRVQELYESRGGRPGLPSLISPLFLWT